jgi:hypothetical protein
VLTPLGAAARLGPLGAAARRALLLSDTFTRADSAVSLGTAESGQAYTVHAGTFGISGNRAYSASDANNDRASADAGFSDGNFSVAVRGQIAGATIYRTPCLLFRGNDATNFLMLMLLAGTVYLHKCDAGVFTVLASPAQTTLDDTEYALRALCAGNDVQVYVNDVWKATHTLAGGNTKYAAYTRAGFRLAKNGSPTIAARWDNLLVEAA